MKRSTRRQFMGAAGVGALVGSSALALGQAPQGLGRGGGKRVVGGWGKGHKVEGGEGLTCVTKAFKVMAGGGDVLDAVIAGVNIVELDPEDTGVGYGGLPN